MVNVEDIDVFFCLAVFKCSFLTNPVFKFFLNFFDISDDVIGFKSFVDDNWCIGEGNDDNDDGDNDTDTDNGDNEGGDDNDIDDDDGDV